MDGVLTVICSASYLIAVRVSVTALSRVTFSAVAQLLGQRCFAANGQPCCSQPVGKLFTTLLN